MPGKSEPVLEVVFYETTSGNEPVREWLRTLKSEDAGACTRIGTDIKKVQWAWPVGKPLVDPIGSGLYEVRSTWRKKEYRVVFGIQDGAMVLLDGFRKPPNDFSLARKRWKEIKS